MAEYRKRYVGRIAQGKYYGKGIAIVLDLWYNYDTFWISYYHITDDYYHKGVTLYQFRKDVKWLTGALVNP